jgi:hypothetical protein
MPSDPTTMQRFRTTRFDRYDFTATGRYSRYTDVRGWDFRGWVGGSPSGWPVGWVGGWVGPCLIGKVYLTRGTWVRKKSNAGTTFWGRPHEAGGARRVGSVGPGMIATPKSACRIGQHPPETCERATRPGGRCEWREEGRRGGRTHDDDSVQVSRGQGTDGTPATPTPRHRLRAEVWKRSNGEVDSGRCKLGAQVCSEGRRGGRREILRTVGDGWWCRMEKPRAETVATLRLCVASVVPDVWWEGVGTRVRWAVHPPCPTADTASVHDSQRIRMERTHAEAVRTSRSCVGTRGLRLRGDGGLTDGGWWSFPCLASGTLGGNLVAGRAPALQEG